MGYKKTEHYDEKATAGLMKSYKEIIGLLGEDSEREGLQKTPERVAKAMQYLTQGYQIDAKAIINSAKNLFTKDKNAPASWEPNGSDFLSPSLEEADLMKSLSKIMAIRVCFL